MQRNIEELRNALGTSQSVPYISIQGGNFNAIDTYDELKEDISEYDASTKQKFIDVVIVDINKHRSKLYYEQRFKPGDVAPPTCYSDNGIGPSINAQKPVSVLCSNCPFNQWGSKLYDNGQKTKACTDMKKLAVLIPSYAPDRLWLIRVPAGSLSGLESLSRQLDQIKIDGNSALPIEVLTRLSFAKDSPAPKLVFTVVKPLRRTENGQKLYENAIELFHSNQSIKLIGLDDKPITTGKLLTATETKTTTHVNKPMDEPIDVHYDSTLEADRTWLQGLEATSVDEELRGISNADDVRLSESNLGRDTK